MRDLYHNVLSTQVLNPVVSTTTKTSSNIDLQGFDSATVLFSLGLSGDTLTGSLFWTLTLQHSDNGSSFALVDTADCQDAINSVTVNSMTLDETIYAFGYKGNKRYLRAVATPTGSVSSGMPIGMISLRSNANYNPVI
jgi:hypothetical protein